MTVGSFKAVVSKCWYFKDLEPPFEKKLSKETKLSMTTATPHTSPNHSTNTPPPTASCLHHSGPSNSVFFSIIFYCILNLFLWHVLLQKIHQTHVTVKHSYNLTLWTEVNILVFAGDPPVWEPLKNPWKPLWQLLRIRIDKSVITACLF